MKKYSEYFLCSLLMIAASALYSQTAKGVNATTTFADVAGYTGDTYGLIIGISDYQNFPDLHYADKDARAFADFLRSPAGNNTPEKNIRILTNDSAKIGFISNGLSWLKRQAKEGDRVFIYFSGHGDAINEDEAYLLANDAPPSGDDNNYLAGGVVPMNVLKNRIHELTARKVQVIFITDACRTNELPGKAEGVQYTFRKIMEENMGEFQMNSCSANEVSVEDTQWGGGRGVFSWYLVNGLMGLADADNDGNVSFDEIADYVKKNVTGDTKSKSSPRPRQTPTFFFPDNYMAVSKATKETKDRALMAMKNSSSASGQLVLKGQFKFDDPTDQKNYDQFTQFIKDKKFYSEFSDCAWKSLNELKQSTHIDQERKYDIQDIYIAEVMNYSQEQINQHLQKMLTVITPCYEEINTVFQVADLAADEKKNLMGAYYFFKAIEVAQYAESSFRQDLNNGILWCDSGLAAVPNAAYLYDLKGYIQNRGGMKFEADASYKKAIELAPHWALPQIFLAQNFHDQENDSLALMYDKMALRSDTSARTASMVNVEIGNIYLARLKKSNAANDRDSAITRYKNAIMFDPKSTNAWYDLALVYEKDSLAGDQYISTLRHLVSFDSSNTNARILLADHYFDLDNFDSALYFYRSNFLYDSSARAYYMMGGCYRNKYDKTFASIYLDSAITCYLATVENYDDGYAYLGYCYEMKGDTKTALDFYRVVAKDFPADAYYAYNRMSIIYSKKFLGKHKSKKYLKKALGSQ